MDAEEFRKRAGRDQTVANYLDEVAQGDQADRSVAFDMLFMVAAYALFRLVKNYFDYQRGLNESELRQQMMGEVEALVQKGWDKDKALAVIVRVSQEVASLRADSSVFKTALALLKGPDADTSN